MDIGGHQNNIPSLRARPAGLPRGGAMPVARPRQRFFFPAIGAARLVAVDPGILLFAIRAPLRCFLVE